MLQFDLGGSAFVPQSRDYGVTVRLRVRLRRDREWRNDAPQSQPTNSVDLLNRNV